MAEGEIEKAEGELAVEVREEAPPPSEDETAPPCAEDWWLYTVMVLIFIVVFPLYCLCGFVVWLFSNVDVFDIRRGKPVLKPEDLKDEPVVQRRVAAMKKAILMSGIKVRLGVLLTLWIIVSLSYPGLRNKLVLGSKLWKWTLLAACIFFGYKLISMISGIVIYWLGISRMGNKDAWIYYIQGFRQGMNLLALSTFLLVMWLSYFKTSHGIKETAESKTVLHICTWSFVTFEVSAVLWMIKSALLLKWKADAVYRRFRPRILFCSIGTFFLGTFCEWVIHEEPKIIVTEAWTVDDQEDESGFVDDQESIKSGIVDHEKTLNQVTQIESRNPVTKEEIMRFERKRAKRILMIEAPNLYQIQNAGEYIVDRFKSFSRDDDATYYVLQQCRKIKFDDDRDEQYVSEGDLIRGIDMKENDAMIMLLYLRDEFGSPNISYGNFEKLMARLQTNSIALGRTLSDALEVARVLDNVMISLLLVIVFVAWLLLTDIASTKVLIVLASPLLAATFVFGDTCKKMFEGIIFCFINHPFDVGDLCIIDKTELEVRRMSVLTTTFLVAGTKEKVLYPNSILATIPILNLGGEPNPSDSIEVALDTNHTSILDELQNEINKLFKEDGGQNYKKANPAVVKQTGDSLTIEVRFEHVINTNITTHLDCVEKKRQQKSKLLLQIKQLAEQISNKKALTQ